MNLFIILLITLLISPFSWAETFELKNIGEIRTFLESHPEVAKVSNAVNLSDPYHRYASKIVVNTTEKSIEGFLRCQLDVTWEMISKEYPSPLVFNKMLILNNSNCPSIDSYIYVYKRHKQE